MIKELTACIGQYKKDSLLAPAFVVLEVIMEVLVPLFMADLIDRGIEAGNMSVIGGLGLLLVVLALLSLVFGALSGIFAARASAGFAKNLRQRIFYAVQNYAFGNIDKFSTGGLITRLTTDVTNVQNAFMMIIRIAVRAPVMLVMALVCAVKINAELSTIFLGALVILGLGLFFIMRSTYPIFTKVFKTYDRLNNVVQENLGAMRVVKSFVREKHETEKFNDTSTALYAYSVKAEKILALNSPLMVFVIYASTLIISWFGAQFIVVGDMTTGGLVSLFTYMMQILMSLMMLSFIFVMITMSRASAVRITEVLTEQPELINKEAPRTVVADGSVVMEHVSFSYAGKDHTYCLNDIELSIPAGSTVGILGGTGSGKSTLVQLIPRLYDATAGSVRVGGCDVKDYDMEALRNEVAMVLQKNVLFSGTIKENLRWGNENATDAELVTACEKAAADDFIRTFPKGYDSHIEQGGANVSGGQKQRLCIARALLKKPKILILDDSTSAVDTATDAKIRSGLKETLPETTKIIIAQRVDSVKDADQIIVMDEGRIIACGTDAELTAGCDFYREIAEAQKKGGDVDAQN